MLLQRKGFTTVQQENGRKGEGTSLSEREQQQQRGKEKRGSQAIAESLRGEKIPRSPFSIKYTAG